MSYPQITDYHEAIQHPAQAFIDPDLKQGAVAENNLGLPLVMSGGFALTYAVTTSRRTSRLPKRCHKWRTRSGRTFRIGKFHGRCQRAG